MTTESNSLPSGISRISIYPTSVTLGLSTSQRVHQFQRLFMRGHPFSLGIILGMPEWGRMKATPYCVRWNLERTSGETTLLLDCWG